MRGLWAAVVGAALGVAVLACLTAMAFVERFTTQTPDLIRGLPWLRATGAPEPLPASLPEPLPAPVAPAVASRPVVVDGTTVTVLQPAEVQAFLLADHDRYIANFTATDLRARRVLGKPQYTSSVAASAMNVALTPAHTLAVARLCRQADAFFASRPKLSWALDGAQVARLPWVVAFTPAAPPPCRPVSDAASIPLPSYEDGLPHTRGKGTDSVVFLPLSFLEWDPALQVQTLVHEKVHVYQRAYPQETADLVAAPYVQPDGKTVHFERMFPVSSRPANSPVRSNPDTGDWYYGACETPAPPGAGPEWALKNDCRPMGVLYGGTTVRLTDPSGTEVDVVDGPNCVTDTRPEVRPEQEHPFEVMAYDVANAYLQHLKTLP